MRLTVFQEILWRELEPGVWYDAHKNQGTGGRELPWWFHRDQPQSMNTLVPMVKREALEMRWVDGFPQVRRIGRVD